MTDENAEVLLRERQSLVRFLACSVLVLLVSHSELPVFATELLSTDVTLLFSRLGIWKDTDELLSHLLIL